MSQSRVTENADFIYLQDSLLLAEESRAMTSLPLQKSARIVLRDTRKAQSLEIENKRRTSKGLPLLDGIEVAAIEEDSADSDSTAAADSDTEAEEEEERDALLLEAGNILIDVVNAKNQMVASNPGKAKKAQIN